ncbi:MULTISPECIES: hypothetical protein [unclassified Enterococcus]|jgi:hypothetical protein|uniref:hypothetical protein n=1 Tax=unclassified Enterococcus TaxID=2608891 RepID=UPI00112084CE|nr:MULTISPECIES: hypothetical protein [unclassified Enterococcus]TPE02127.1 hypothetical protein FJP08_10750 [Enterococcus sp. PF-3]TPE25524.1 hypothetical protein FJO98_11470 [Enterococcus sp. PF-2]
MVSINDKHLIEFIYHMNSYLTFNELNEWASKLIESSDEMIEYAFSDKAFDIVQLSDEYEQNYVIENFITIDEYLSKHYSSAISLLLRLPNLKNELMDSKYNSNNKRFQIYQGNGHVATYAQQILYSLSNKYDLI